MDEYQNDYEKASTLEYLLLARATGEEYDDDTYKELRTYFIKTDETKKHLPSFVIKCHSLNHFWHFIKPKYSTYAERRDFISSKLLDLFLFLEQKKSIPSDNVISDQLKAFNENRVHEVWTQALSRRYSDPEGAITSAQTLLETVCKHILDDMQVSYDEKKIKLSELYKITAKKLKLSSDVHTEELFKQILGNCSGIVRGLGLIRNSLGDGHGKGKTHYKPSSHHAALAVNLSGSMSLFLVERYKKITTTL